MIDITFDFRSDSKGKDPDGYSPTLNAYHRALWSKELPNGEVMELQSGRAPYAFQWKEFWFSSDTIIIEMTHLKNKKIIDQVRERISDFDEYIEHLLHRSYTIGSMVIFPVHNNSMNQRKGTNPRIADRWDLTLECIRRHYAGEESPLSNVIESDKAGFTIHKVARAQTDELLTVTFRVIGQAVASGHMKEHGMVASDYAIKLINLMYPCDMSKVIEERQWQLSKLDELSQ